MLISMKYGLDGSLPFVDVDTEKDTCLFVDPTRISNDFRTPEAVEAVRLLDSYTAMLVREVVAETTALTPSPRLQQLVANLHEPNETRLGFTKIGSKGHGVGRELGDLILEALQDADTRVAVVSHVEELKLLVPRIGDDLVSDLVTRVIMIALVSFTRRMMSIHPELADETTRFQTEVWDETTCAWIDLAETVPALNGTPLILVPREWVGESLLYCEGQFYRREATAQIQAVETHYLPSGKALSPSKGSIYGRHRAKGTPVKAVNLNEIIHGLGHDCDLLDHYRQLVTKEKLG